MKHTDFLLLGTTMAGPKAPLRMVTMDATQGRQRMSLIKSDVTMYVRHSMRKMIMTDSGDRRPIHYDDCDVFLNPFDDVKIAVSSAGWFDRAAYLDRADKYMFAVTD